MAVANQTEEGSWPNKAVRASRLTGIAMMLGFLSIFAGALAGFAGVGPWSVGAAAIALASISHTQHQRLYERGQQSGSGQFVQSTVLRSFANALMAAGAAYGLGTLINIL